MAFVLTVLTQVGGAVYLLSWLIYLVFIRRRLTTLYGRVLSRGVLFAGMYVVVVLWIVPPVALHYGRVPLPFFEKQHVKPRTIWYALLARNYVRPALREATFAVAAQLQASYPGTAINYLDAGFPFFDKFPLLPHLSHDDGKKLDIAFFYRNKVTDEAVSYTPSCIGYGGSEGPRAGESDRPATCAAQGYWQYSALARYMPLTDGLIFDEARTRAMIQLFCTNHSIGKLLLEPHLKQRWHLTSPKLRLHGCKAVRHDDHVHVQL